MTHGTGNQYMSRKRALLALLARARACLLHGGIVAARFYLDAYRQAYATVPSGTRRRWKCGR